MKRSNLIIDVGMHTGEDTAFYLAKGFDVAAIEANPYLVEAAERQFAQEIAQGRLTIHAVAIAETHGTMPLAVADNTVWSSLSSDFVERNKALFGTEYRYVDVPTAPFEDILGDVGIPHYLKIDIEGFDMLCVSALRHFERRPTFVSVESSVSVNRAPAGPVLSELRELWELGYRRFLYVDQRRNPERQPPRPAREGRYVDLELASEGSGLFGDEAPGRWLGPAATLARSQFLRLNHNLGGHGGRWSRGDLGWRYQRILRRRVGWFDLHARLSVR